MAEYNNTSNNNNRPSGAGSVNNAPQRLQNISKTPTNNMQRPTNNMQRPTNNVPRPMGNMSSQINRPMPASQNAGLRKPAQVPTKGGNIPPRAPSGDLQGRPTGVASQRVNNPQPTGTNQVQHLNHFNNPNLSRRSASQRFERGSRSLSHINGGTSNKLYRINRDNQGDMLRRQVGGVILDEDLIQDVNQQKLTATKSKQKTAAIVILSVLLVLSLLYLAFAIAGYSKNGKSNNCKYYITSDVSAHWVLDNNTETEFVLREGLASGKIYEIESILFIDSNEKVNIKITISAILNGREIFISGLEESADNLVRVDSKNSWVYVGGHQGFGEVYLFKGIDFFGAPENLTSDNVTITVHAEITKEQ